MKLIIEIPNYNNLNDIQNGSIACSQVLKAVKNGKPYKENRKGEWISVNKRLPDKDGEYLVTLNILGDRSREIIEYRTNRGWGFFKKKIIAWQPLPEEYKEDNEND